MTVKLTRFEQDASTHDLGGGNSSRWQFASPAGTKMGVSSKNSQEITINKWNDGLIQKRIRGRLHEGREEIQRK